jgi:hypothetical protein
MENSCSELAKKKKKKPIRLIAHEAIVAEIPMWISKSHQTLIQVLGFHFLTLILCS